MADPAPRNAFVEYFAPCIDPITGLFGDGIGGIIPNMLKCPCYLEFMACSTLAVVGGSFANDAFKTGLLFVLMYVLFECQFKRRLRANPVLSFADWMVSSQEAGSGWSVMWTILFQCLGYSFGIWIHGLIGLTSAFAAPVEDSANFTGLLIDEVISCGFLVWLWLHIHESSKSAWNDFMGFAVGLAIWLAASLKSGSAYMNPAIKIGVDMNNQEMRNYTISDFFVFFSPVIGAFVTALVYVWFRK